MKNNYINLHKRTGGKLDELHIFHQVQRFTRIYYGYSTILLIFFRYGSIWLENIATGILVFLFGVQILLFVLSSFAYGNLLRIPKVNKNFVYIMLFLFLLLSFIFLNVIEVYNHYTGLIILSPNFVPVFAVVFAIIQEFLLHSFEPKAKQ